MVRNSDNWKQSIRKRRRQSGKSYVNEKGKTVDKRKITKSCGGKINVDWNAVIIFQRKIEIKYSNSLGRWMILIKVCFIQTLLTKKKRKEHYKKWKNSSRKFSFQHFFIISNKKNRVCKEIYISTLAIIQRRLQCCFFFFFFFLYKKKSIFVDKRGRHAKSKISNDAKKFIRDHINWKWR